MRIVCDFHIHSKYAQATSRYADLFHYAEGAKKKGVDVVGTGDVLHPEWRKEIKENIMRENGELDEERGIYEFKGVYFLLSTEVCTQEEREGKIRRVHHVIHFPSFEIVEQVADALSRFGSLEEDGRPLLRMSPAHLVEIIKNISKDVELYPAHAWTPWFGVLGSKSGYESIEHAYENKAHFIWALETGLSSDPPMNWMVSSLDKYVLISNSDAHSPGKLAREGNVLDVNEINYKEITNAMKSRKGFVKTYEFFPEEGKYHYDGHRKCGIWLNPWEAMKINNICPVCRKPLTIGVLHRVVEMADYGLGRMPRCAIPYQHIVPLRMLISKALKKGEGTKAVAETYDYLIRYFGNELNVFEAKEEVIMMAIDDPVRDAILKVKRNQIKWRPGYDGVFGELLLEGEVKEKKDQLHLGEFF